MTIYQRYGVEPIINAAGTLTRLGGSIPLPEVQDAMDDAARALVPMDKLQAAAGKVISRVCGSESGYVVSGAAAGLTLSAAACMVGLDVAKMDRLPSSQEIPNEIIICRHHRNSYDHAYRAAGASLVEVGVSDRYSGAGVRDTEVWEIEAAVSDRTAAIAYTAGFGSLPPLPEVTAMAAGRGIPVIVDAAAQLPPPDNLNRFVREGADLVCFSGGKALRGPQGTGILAGRRDLIASVALQHLDMDVTQKLWDPPADLIPKDRIQGAPRHGIGRGFKVSKEQVAGAITALELFTVDRCRKDVERWNRLIDTLAQGLGNIAGIRTERPAPRSGTDYPMLHIVLDESTLGQTAMDAAEHLIHGSPPIHVGEKYLMDGVFLIHPFNLDDASVSIIVSRIKELFR
jgi:D-glucosaminate-6-phosphate ammonia-lyase